jgi:hypothetical protein
MNEMIKLELLKLAKEILIEENMSTRIKLENDWHASTVKEPFPEVPSVKGKDVIKLATLLDKFVSQNDEKSD